MKARHKKKADGGPTTGTKDWEEDEKTKPMRYTADSKVNSEAEERKHGGRAKHNSGGMVKHVGKVHGEKPRMHAGRKPRKAGGRTGSNFNPLSSAHKGSGPIGHADTEVD